MTKESCIWLEILLSSQNRELHIMKHCITCVAQRLNYINIKLIFHLNVFGDGARRGQRACMFAYPMALQAGFVLSLPRAFEAGSTILGSETDSDMTRRGGWEGVPNF